MIVTAPSCYDSDPSPQTQAENGCEDCLFQNRCLGGVLIEWLGVDPAIKKTGQSQKHSVFESWVNIFIGWVINFSAQLFIFHQFGVNLKMADNLKISGFFTIVSFARSYFIRRWFNRLMVNKIGSRN